MPAIMDDPDAPTIYRVSGAPPYPDAANPTLPPSVVPRQVTLRDRQTVATVVPFASRTEVPPSLLLYLSDQFRKEIEGGDTYPMVEPMPLEKFASYWFQNFGGVMLLGRIERAADVVEGRDWSTACLGSFYIKPNYPGRSSHVCNAGFLVTDAARNRGVGRLMGETYLDWAPKLGYTYSVFNLVYETNVASCRIWDGLGFKRIGRVKGCGNLKSHPGRLVDAIIYGRELGGSGGSGSGGAGSGGDADDLVSDDRFDKIKFYLKYGEYPTGADRAEKSRLRSAATTYKLLDGDVLMLKDKEVVSNPDRQLAIARDIHLQQHAGINKTTATIAERYHWTRIKDTVSDVIRNCTHCKEPARGGSQPLPVLPAFSAAPVDTPMSMEDDPTQTPAQTHNPALHDTQTLHTHTHQTHTHPLDLPQHLDPLHDTHQPQHNPPLAHFAMTPDNYKGLRGPVSAMSIGQILRAPTESPIPPHAALPGHNPMLQDQPAGLRGVQHPAHHALDTMLPLPGAHSAAAAAAAAAYQQPIDPKIISQPSPPGQHPLRLQLQHPGQPHQQQQQQHHLPQHQQQHHHYHPMNDDDRRHGSSASLPHAPPADPFAGFHDPDAHAHAAHQHHQTHPHPHHLPAHHHHQQPHHPHQQQQPHQQQHHHHHHHHATDAFTSLLNAPDDDDDDDELVGSDSTTGGLLLGSSTGAGGDSSSSSRDTPVGLSGAHHVAAAHGHGRPTAAAEAAVHAAQHAHGGADGVDAAHDDEAAAAAAAAAVAAAAEREAAVDRDLDMLIEPDDDDDDDNDDNGGGGNDNNDGGGAGGTANATSAYGRQPPHAAGLALLPTHGAGYALGGGGGGLDPAVDAADAGHHDGSGEGVADNDAAVDSIAGVVHVVNLGGSSGDGGGSGGQRRARRTPDGATSNRTAMDLTGPPPPPELDLAGTGAGAGADSGRAVSKMDIGRLLTTSAAAAAAAAASDEAAAAAAAGPSDGMNGIVVDGGAGRASDDERLEDMAFGLA